jgi:hypothetical protein
LAGIEKEIWAVKVLISQDDFFQAFGLTDRDLYQIFTDKLTLELGKTLHPSAVVESICLESPRRDDAGNVHVVLHGRAKALKHEGQIGGEFVWLKNLRAFRGKTWSSLENPSDATLLLMARESFRRSMFRQALMCLDAVQNQEAMPRWTEKLKKILQTKDFDG